MIYSLLTHNISDRFHLIQLNSLNMHLLYSCLRLTSINAINLENISCN